MAASLPTLTNLTLHLNLASNCKPHCQWWDHRQDDHHGGEEAPCEGIDLYEQPLLNTTTATMVFEFLCTEKVGQPLG